MQQRVCSAVGVVVMTNPGDWLRGLREELHLTRVAVERFTSEAASRANNERIGFGGDGSRRLKKAGLCRIFLKLRACANVTK
jgi:hypothetical protein